jgi:hypothetical protein
MEWDLYVIVVMWNKDKKSLCPEKYYVIIVMEWDLYIMLEPEKIGQQVEYTSANKL